MNISKLPIILALLAYLAFASLAAHTSMPSTSRQYCKNPFITEVISCKRVWYAPWKKKCKTKKGKCYNVHRYKWACYGVVSREKLYYFADCSKKEKYFTKTRPCIGLKFKGSGCFKFGGVKSSYCPGKFSVSGSAKKKICK